MSYRIVTDTGSDLTWEMIQEMGLIVLPLPILVEDQPYRDIFETEDQVKEFYRVVRDEKKVATTSRVSLPDFERAVRGILDGGDDVFFIGFSSGLSSSTPALLEFLPTLAPEYPERKIEMIDSLLPSGGMALFLHYIVERQRSGASLDELVAYAYELRPKVACWFTVDDLMFLHRGGRLSRASALAGTALGIKPVLHVDDEGHLIMMSKAKSRRKSMRALIDKLRTTGIEPISEQTIYINHGDCLDEAKIMGETIREEFGCQDITYLYTAPVIGAHSGPGTLSVFFLAHER